MPHCRAARPKSEAVSAPLRRTPKQSSPHRKHGARRTIRKMPSGLRVLWCDRLAAQPPLTASCTAARETEDNYRRSVRVYYQPTARYAGKTSRQNALYASYQKYDTAAPLHSSDGITTTVPFIAIGISGICSGFLQPTASAVKIKERPDIMRSV